MSEHDIRIGIKKIFIFFMFFSMLMAFLWLLKPQSYFNLRSYWTMSGNVIQFKDASWNRFTFVQSDPNNVGAILCSMMLYLFIYGDLETWEKIGISIIALISVIISISTTGCVIYIMSVLLYFSVTKWHIISGKVKAKGMFMLMSLFVGGVVLLIFIGSQKDFSMDFLKLQLIELVQILKKGLCQEGR